MTALLNILLRAIIWFLLTADLSPINITIGLAIAFLLPHRPVRLGALKDWLRTLGELIWAIPQAYWEAFEMIVCTHKEEDVVMERVRPRRTSALIFLDIFLITFTPKTIVLKYHQMGWYEVHRLHGSKKS